MKKAQARGETNTVIELQRIASELKPIDNRNIDRSSESKISNYDADADVFIREIKEVANSLKAKGEFAYAKNLTAAAQEFVEPREASTSINTKEDREAKEWAGLISEVADVDEKLAKKLITALYEVESAKKSKAKKNKKAEDVEAEDEEDTSEEDEDYSEEDEKDYSEDEEDTEKDGKKKAKKKGREN